MMKRIQLFVICISVLLAGLVLSVLHVALRSYAVPLDLSAYTTLGLGSEDRPTAIIDVDAILNDLRLPNPGRRELYLADYPDVQALLQMQVSLAYTEAPGAMELTVHCDTDTLRRYGIAIHPLAWTQEVKGTIALDSTQPEPLAAPRMEEEEAPEPLPIFDLQPGRLTSLLDAGGNGLPLRPVYECVRAERDAMCKKLFPGNEYSVSKTQTIFVADEGRDTVQNLYRATYAATQTGEGAAASVTHYFTVELRNLTWTEAGQVTFSGVETRPAADKQAAESTAAYAGARYRVSILPGGGISNLNRVPFDQNGFVRFPALPTSYRLSGGLYWSPTFEPLLEDNIWQLTGVSGHSLPNLLRYARKEIAARYGSPFNPERDGEFFGHYGARAWYSPDPDYTDERMTEVEARNIRLLREIQSLIEN